MIPKKQNIMLLENGLTIGYYFSLWAILTFCFEFNIYQICFTMLFIICIYDVCFRMFFNVTFSLISLGIWNMYSAAGIDLSFQDVLSGC